MEKAYDEGGQVEKEPWGFVGTVIYVALWLGIYYLSHKYEDVGPYTH